MKLPLYPWQEECLDAWFSHGCHGIANVVTGAGKTILALAATERLRQRFPNPLRVKIVVPTISLLSQWRDALLEFTDLPSVSRDDIGYCYGGRKDDPNHDYMIYVINSARYCLARHILNDLKEGYSVLLIADECHHYASQENQKIFDFLPCLKRTPGQYYSLGLSATPQSRGYEAALVPALGQEIYRYGFTDAARRSTISPFVVFQVALAFDAEEAAAYEDLSSRITRTLNRLEAMCPSLRHLNRDQFFGRLNLLAGSPESVIASLANTALALTWQRKSLICGAKSRLACALSLIASLEPGAKILLFGERIEQADQVYHLLEREYPHQVGRCHSGLGRQARRNALERFRSGELRILVSCRSLDEGFDVPYANVGIVLSSASVERQRIQRLGRILRRQKNKDLACLYYFYLQNSTEEPSFASTLPQEACSCDLSYSVDADFFVFPEYEEIAGQFLWQCRRTSQDRAVWREVYRCLIKGVVRPDWLLGQLLGKKAWEKKISLARTVEEKNYWICMREMGRLREERLSLEKSKQLYDD